MQFADTVIDQLWEVWRISQVDKCEKVRTGDSGMGLKPLHTLISLECELWPLQVLRQMSEVHFYPCNADPSQRSIKDKVKKLILCLFTQYQEAVELNWAIGKNWSYMTWQKLIIHDMTTVCKHFPFSFFTQWSQPVDSTRTPDIFFSIKLNNLWKRHVFVHILL